MPQGYFLKIAGRPFCDHTSCEAGRALAARANVDKCAYRLRREALSAMRRLNALDGYAGVASIHPGPCPSLPQAKP